MLIHYMNYTKYVHEKGVEIGRLIERVRDGDIIVVPTVDDRLTVGSELRKHFPSKSVEILLPEEVKRQS
jgi:uncharacterized linocin/CFP29 family protein